MSHHISIIINIILIYLSISSGYTDYRYRLIYNTNTFGAIVTGLLLYSASFGLKGFMLSIEGLFLGISLVIIFYILGAMGGGDVKLFGAIGCLGGSSFVFQVFVYSTIIGGIMGIIYIFYKKPFLESIQKLFYMVFHPFKAHKIEQIYLPYGIAISLSCLIILYQGM